MGFTLKENLDPDVLQAGLDAVADELAASRTPAETDRIIELTKAAIAGGFDRPRLMRAMVGLPADATSELLSAEHAKVGAVMEKVLREKGLLE